LNGGEIFLEIILLLEFWACKYYRG